MANPYCFKSTDKLGKIESAIESYVETLNEIHQDTIPAEEWAVACEGLKNSDREDVASLATKPQDDLISASGGNAFYQLETNAAADGGEFSFAEEVREQTATLGAAAEGVKSVLHSFNAMLTTLQVNLGPQFQDFVYSGGWREVTIQELKEYVDVVPPDYDGRDAIVNEFELLELTIQKLSNSKCPTKTELEEIYVKSFRRLAALAQAEAEEEKYEQLAVDAAGTAAIAGAQLLAGDFSGAVITAGTGVLEAKANLDAADKKAADSLKKAKQIIDLIQAQRQVYSEQCFLLNYIDNLVSANMLGNLPYFGTNKYNFPLTTYGEPFGYMNRLVVDPSQSELFTLNPETVSQLIPHMRFFKVESDESGVDKEIEISFDSNIKNDITVKGALRRQRGYGVGVRNFTFSYDGTDPFSAKKAISAKLSIYASTFDDLLRERKDKKNQSYSYAELALKTGGFSGDIEELTKLERDNLNKLNFRLKATVGWSAPKDTFVSLTPAQKKAVYNSFITMYLTPTIHSFNFDETGALTFDIEYLAYIEDAFSQKQYNIFSSLTPSAQAREALFDYYVDLGCNLENGKEFKQFRKADEQVVSEINLAAFNRLMTELAAKDKIYYLNLTYQEISQLLNDPSANVPFPKPVANAGLSEDLIAEITAEAKKGDTFDGSKFLSLAAVSEQHESISYFYLQDIIGVAMELIEKDLGEGSKNLLDSEYVNLIRSADVIDGYDETKYLNSLKDKQTILKNSLQQFQQMRVVLGPLEIFSSIRDIKTLLFSMGDMPISVNYFFEFMSKKVLEKNIINYPFSKFIKDLVNDLIKNFLNSGDCTAVDSSQKLSLNSTTISAYNRMSNDKGAWSPERPPIDDITDKIVSSPAPEREPGEPVLYLGGERDAPVESLTVDRMINYFVFTVGRKSPHTDYLGDRNKDSGLGIFHYMLGENRGIVKNITLERTQATGLKEVRFEQEGYNGLEQLREVYNVSIDTFLNVQSFPGVYIYVEPKGFSPSTKDDLTRFGIGGYYMIYKTTHTIAPGVADTNIQAAWVASKGEEKEVSDGSSTEKTVRRKPSGQEKIKKCLVGPHEVDMIVLGRGRYSSLSYAERGMFGSDVVSTGQGMLDGEKVQPGQVFKGLKV